MASRVRALTKVFFSDVLGSFFWFPFWWYGEGLVGVIRWGRVLLHRRWREYAMGLWIRNFFVPMYGAYDWVGRLISLVVRAAVILARLSAFTIEALFCVLITLLWCVAPIGCVIALLLNLSSLGEASSWFS